MGRYDYDNGWPPYVTVAERRRRAEKKLKSLRKKGMDLQPVAIDGRKIARTFWGQAWCSHMESFSDYSNRLPRGRSYVRNGSVCHLGIVEGEIDARVAGSSLYTVQAKIKKLPAAKWLTIKRQAAGKIGSLLELLQGKLSDQVMGIVTDRVSGLFPHPREISFECDCPDWAGMCKHIAAVMYGIGARLDHSPELLFTLRGVNHEELIVIDAAATLSTSTPNQSRQIAAGDLSDVFGIDFDYGGTTHAPTPLPSTAPGKKQATKKATKKVMKQATKKAQVKKAPAKKVSRKKVRTKKKTSKGKISR